ncbi:hypothetical protein ACIB24_00120 [Spongisporangium articulatum]|uniref:Uncharacterized protein n=1 Tax=Spongisporangium articulatum TaxID=3362603 RepID=A0ABW8AGH0_9ACTN
MAKDISLEDRPVPTTDDSTDPALTVPPPDQDLDRARVRSQAARASLEAGEAAVEHAQLALVTHEARVTARRRSLKQARKQIEHDEAALKKLKREKPELDKRLKNARRAAEKALKKARKQEGKYDEAMLRHVVDREKTIDRTLHTV